MNSGSKSEDYQQFAKRRHKYLISLLYPLINFIRYALGNIVDSNEIVIDNEIYDHKHIRNYIVHGRWIN